MGYGKPGASARIYIAPNSAFTTLTHIGNAVSIGVSGMERGAEDVTVLTDTWQEFEPSLPNAGQLDLEFNYQATATGTTACASSLLHGYLQSGTKVWWGVRFMESTSNATTFTDTSWSRFACEGFVTSLGHDLPGPTGIAKTTATIKLTGQPKYQPVGSAWA